MSQTTLTTRNHTVYVSSPHTESKLSYTSNPCIFTGFVEKKINRAMNQQLYELYSMKCGFKAVSHNCPCLLNILYMLDPTAFQVSMIFSLNYMIFMISISIHDFLAWHTVLWNETKKPTSRAQINDLFLRAHYTNRVTLKFLRKTIGSVARGHGLYNRSKVLVILSHL